MLFEKPIADAASTSPSSAYMRMSSRGANPALPHDHSAYLMYNEKSAVAASHQYSNEMISMIKNN